MPDSPLFARCNSVVLWVVQTTVRFNRAHRASIGRMAQEAAFRLQRNLIAATRRISKQRALQEADEALHELRFLLRQCHELNLISAKQFAYIVPLCDEVGRLLGGWRKTQRGQPEPPAAV